MYRKKEGIATLLTLFSKLLERVVEKFIQNIVNFGGILIMIKYIIDFFI